MGTQLSKACCSSTSHNEKDVTPDAFIGEPAKLNLHANNYTDDDQKAQPKDNKDEIAGLADQQFKLQRKTVIIFKQNADIPLGYNFEGTELDDEDLFIPRSYIHENDDLEDEDFDDHYESENEEDSKGHHNHQVKRQATAKTGSNKNKKQQAILHHLDFDYKCQGIDWVIPKQVTMTMQSPIDIKSDEIQKEDNFKVEIKWLLGDQIKVEDVKYSLKVTLTDMGGIELYDLEGVGPLHYKLDNAHCHAGTEHTFNGQRYDLEFHFVHVLDYSDYKHFADCSPAKRDRKHAHDNYQQNLAVVGILFQESDHSHPFIVALQQKYEAEIHNLDCKKLLFPEDKEAEFYHYQGSLTTPPCIEAVNWIVFKEVLPISKEHLEIYRKFCQDNHGHGNYREILPLNERRIVKNFN